MSCWLSIQGPLGYKPCPHSFHCPLARNPEVRVSTPPLADRFILRPTAENDYGFGDLRPYHPDTVNFIGQAWHKTAKYTYTDTLNYLIYAPPKGSPQSSTMKVHSISQIGGAYCDDGQNYKNIVVLIKALKVPYKELSAEGCPASGVETN